MISRRVPRHSSPQENLKQFALNNSKGIDITKAPTDTDTVLDATNLVTNFDGSLSIRKPVVALTSKRYPKGTSRVEYLYDNTHKLVWNAESSTISILDSANKPCEFKIHTLKSDGKEFYQTLTELPYSWFDSVNFEVVNTVNTTVLGNVTVSNRVWTGNSFEESLLYEDGVGLSRYLKIQKLSDNWDIEIMVPEVNVLSTAEDGSLAFDINLTLDNPYALRDTYGTVVPSVKGILAYSGSTLLENKTTVPSPVEFLDGGFTFELMPPEVLKTSEISNIFQISSISKANGWADETPAGAAYERLSKTFELDFSSPLNGRVRLTVTCTKNSLEEAVQNYTFNFKTTVIKAPILYESTVTTLESKGYSLVSFVKRGSASVSNYSTVYASKTWIKTGSEDFDTGLNAKEELTLNAKEVREASVTFKVSYDLTAYSQGVEVRQLTESVKDTSYRIISSLKGSENLRHTFLKAFCNLPKQGNYYATWLKSYDGVVWEDCPQLYSAYSYLAREPIVAESAEGVDESDANITYVEHVYQKLSAASQSDTITAPNDVSVPRVDVYQVPSDELPLDAMYMFKIVSIKTSINEFHDAVAEVDVEYGRAIFSPPVSNKTEFAVWTLGNPVLGSKLYYNKKLFSYGSDGFENNIFVTEPGSVITPLSYVIDSVNATSNTITALVPWKSYLLSATETNLSLHIPQEIGWASKLLTTSVGISADDSKCCKASLNNVIFKANDKILLAYPNTYSGDDTYVYVTDISKPVEHLLSEYSGDGTQFAISTNSEYILMLPKDNCTECLRYSYDDKSWSHCTYPIRVTSYKMYSLTNIVLFGTSADGTFAEYQFDADSPADKYYDIIVNESWDAVPTPIEFELDTGMKTDNISMQKQFVESKLIFATEDDLEIFPINVTVAIDGDPHVTHTDVNSDSPFWKTHPFSRGVVGTSFRLSTDDALGRSSSGIFRQLVIRYSGKGRSIRHILRGSSQSNFRLYETYVRYKTLNVKR